MISETINTGVLHIYFILPLSKLKSPTAYYNKNVGIWLQFKVEEESKEFKMGLDAQKSFAQMYEDRNMN